jgi:hypothetical protein
VLETSAAELRKKVTERLRVVRERVEAKRLRQITRMLAITIVCIFIRFSKYLIKNPPTILAIDFAKKR